MRVWLRCMTCGAKELLNDRTKFDGGCLHCGGGPRTAEDDDGKPMLVSTDTADPTDWSAPETQ